MFILCVSCSLPDCVTKKNKINAQNEQHALANGQEGKGEKRKKEKKRPGHKTLFFSSLLELALACFASCLDPNHWKPHRVTLE